MKNTFDLEILTPLEYYKKGLELLSEKNNDGIKYLLTAGDNNYLKGYHAVGMYYALKKNYQDALFYIFKAYDRGYYDLKELLYVYCLAHASGLRSHKKQMNEVLTRIPTINVIKDYALLSYIGICLYIFDKKKEAGPYLKKAVRKEEGEMAYYHLALCYLNGEGIDEDIEYAYTCLMLANEYPSKEAIEKETLKFKRKGLIKKKWKYKEKYALKNKKSKSNI